MKRLFLFLLSTAFLIAGCTSKEQDEKINAFWTEQQMKLMMKGSEQAMKTLSNPAAAEMFGKIASMNLNMPGRKFTQEDMTDEEKAEFEKLLKEMQAEMDSPTTGKAKPDTPDFPAAAAPKTAPAVAPKPVEASLFLSPTCPWCKKLQKEGFTKKFQRKYNGKVNLTEYMLTTSENKSRYSRAVKKHKLNGGVPLLIIGDTPIQGYSEEMMKVASEAAEKEMKKHKITSDSVAASKGPAILEVSMEDEEIIGAAPSDDKKRMKELILAMQEFNGEMIQSLELTFGQSVKNKGMSIAANTEKKLKQAANNSPDFQTFYTQYQKISKQNDAEMEKLMQQNIDKIH